MNKKTLESQAEYEAAIKRTMAIFQSEEGTPQADELASLLLLVKDYESMNIVFPEPERTG